MRKRIASLLGGFIFAAMAALSTPVLAAEPAVILIVSVQELLMQSDAGKAVRDDIEKAGNKIHEDGQKLVETFTGQARSLDEKRASLSPEEFEKQVGELRANEEEKRRKHAARTQALQAAAQKARAEMIGVLRPIFAELMAKHGGTIMIDQSMIVAGGADLDVTAEAMKLMNERLPKVSVDLLNPAPVGNAQ